MGSARALAAPCCGGGSAAPTVLTGDDRLQLSASVSQAQIIGDAPEAGGGLPLFRSDSDHETTQTLRLEGAVLLSDRWQAGASLPLVRRARSTAASASAATGLGDLGLSAAYEILPEWSYSAWRPRGFVFAQGLIPAGGSVYQSTYSTTDLWGLDARGRGFYTVGAGALFLKSWGDWDASFTTELHRSFPRTFTTDDLGDLRLSPGWGGSAALSAGYSLSTWPLRLGLSLQPTAEGSIGVRSSTTPLPDSQAQLVWNTAVQVGWMLGRSSTVSAVYNDQTLIGPAINTSLSRTLSVLYQQRWER